MPAIAELVRRVPPGDQNPGSPTDWKDTVVLDNLSSGCCEEKGSTTPS